MWRVTKFIKDAAEQNLEGSQVADHSAQRARKIVDVLFAQIGQSRHSLSVLKSSELRALQSADPNAMCRCPRENRLAIDQTDKRPRL